MPSPAPTRKVGTGEGTGPFVFTFGTTAVPCPAPPSAALQAPPYAPIRSIQIYQDRSVCRIPFCACTTYRQNDDPQPKQNPCPPHGEVSAGRRGLALCRDGLTKKNISNTGSKYVQCSPRSLSPHQQHLPLQRNNFAINQPYLCRPYIYSGRCELSRNFSIPTIKWSIRCPFRKLPHFTTYRQLFRKL